MSLTVVAKVKAKAAQRDHLCGLWKTTAFATLEKEAGCLSYELLTSRTDPNQILSIERWKDQASIDAHMKKSYVVSLLQMLPGLIEGAPEIAVYSTF